MSENTLVLSRRFDHFEVLFQEYEEATSLTRESKLHKLISQVDVLSLTEEGIAYLYGRVLDLITVGVLEGTAWADPAKLQAVFVKGTLKSGHPGSSLEVMSELRMLALAKGDLQADNTTAQEAKEFLEEVIAHNLEFVFQSPTEETRATMSEHEMTKASQLFRFLMDEATLAGLRIAGWTSWKRKSTCS